MTEDLHNDVHLGFRNTLYRIKNFISPNDIDMHWECVMVLYMHSIAYIHHLQTVHSTTTHAHTHSTHADTCTPTSTPTQFINVVISSHLGPEDCLDQFSFS